MNRILIVISLILAFSLYVMYRICDAKDEEIKRLDADRSALLHKAEFYETELGKSVASVEKLTMSVDELRRERSTVIKEIASLKLKLKRVESVSTTLLKSDFVFSTPLRDSVGIFDTSQTFDGIAADTVCVIDGLEQVALYNEVVGTPLKFSDELFENSVSDRKISVSNTKVFSWKDDWVSVRGMIKADSVSCNITSVDTLHQIVHRVPRRFLFFRYGVKAIRQEVASTNPHSKIVYAEYIVLR